METGPYAWRSARSRNSQNSTEEEMAAHDRRPSFNIRGQIRGFRSAPGAPLSPRDTMSKLGVKEPLESPNHEFAWSQFFKRDAQPGAPVVTPPVTPPTGDYMGSDLSAIPLPATPQQNITSAIAGNSAWMQKQGLPIPPQPSVIPTVGVTPKPPILGGNFRSRYGTASVSYGAPKASVSNPWGKPIPFS